MRNVSGLETVYRDYLPKGVKFFYVYKSLAHPEVNGYVTPFTLEERLMHVAEAERTLGSEIPWLCDTMENDAKHALGDAPNSEFIVDPEGNIVVKRFWSNPGQLREDLVSLIGEVDNPTRVADLDLESREPPQRAKTGIVPRLDVPRGLRPLKVVPLVSDDAEHPFYVKLRAEGDNDLVRSGEGQLYLRFSLDPLYQVHWNNQVDPPRYVITVPDGFTVSADSNQAPPVEEKADADPREFLLDVSGNTTGEPLALEFHYFACDDAETFCIPVTQRYEIYLERDSDGGSRMGNRGRGQAGNQPPARGGRGGQQFNGQQMLARMMAMDKNEDGKLTEDEVEGSPVARMMDRADTNGDGALDKSELEEMLRRRFGQGRGGNQRRNPTRDDGN